MSTAAQETKRKNDAQLVSGYIHGIESTLLEGNIIPNSIIQIITEQYMSMLTREELSVIWEKPRVTIQMISEFIERLPLSHKEKIWRRHATEHGTEQYITKNKILHTLHSFTALCIKIKDRTAVAPSRHDIEKELTPFATVVKRRIENENGMTLHEFNNELHYWILEPVSGLIMAAYEQERWLGEIDTLRDELLKTQEIKRKIEMKSQMECFKLHCMVNELQDEIKANVLEIKGLNEENAALRDRQQKESSQYASQIEQFKADRDTYEETSDEYKHQFETLQKENKTLEESKIRTITKLANTIQELRETVTILSRECDDLSKRNNLLENRTTVQHITSSFSSWL